MLAFDLHGVIMNLMPVMLKYFKEVVGFEVTETGRFSFGYPDSYDPRRFGVDIANSIKLGVATQAKPMRGSIQALEDWVYNTDNTIVIITASAKSTMDANIEWLHKYLVVPFEIHRVAYQEKKSDTCNKLGVTHFVDDRFKTCNDLIRDGLETTYLYNSTHNEGREPDEGVVRVDNLRQAIKLYEQ